MRSKKFRSTLITFGMVVAAFIACQVMISTGAIRSPPAIRDPVTTTSSSRSIGLAAPPSCA